MKDCLPPAPNSKPSTPAFVEAMALARDREERMPLSAAALRDRAANILSVCKKLLARMSEVDRRNYPPAYYKK